MAGIVSNLGIGLIFLTTYFESENANPNVGIAFFILEIILLWIYYAQAIKRCHDRDNSGWYMFIPFYFYWMLFADGCPYENDYGPDPKGRNGDVDAFKPYNYLWILVILSIIFYIGAIIIHTFNDDENTTEQTQYIDKSVLAKNEITDGIIILTLPPNANYSEIETDDGGSALEIFDDEESPNYDITIMSANGSEIDDTLFYNAWENNYANIFGEESYEIVTDEIQHKGTIQIFHKAVKCATEIPVIWDYMIMTDSETEKACIISAQYVEDANISLPEFIDGIRFK